MRERPENQTAIVVVTATELRELVRGAVLEALREHAPADNEILNTEEAAKLLKIHPKTLAKRARLGEVAAERSGNEWRFRRSRLLSEAD